MTINTKANVSVTEDNYRAEIWEYGNAESGHGFVVYINVKIDDGVYRDKYAICDSLPEALHILAGFIEGIEES